MVAPPHDSTLQAQERPRDHRSRAPTIAAQGAPWTVTKIRGALLGPQKTVSKRTRVMSGIVILGCQFGDEGKGKVIDYLAERADVVVRFQGGANAGHTVLVGEEKDAFHLVPSGILGPSTMNVIGNGVVLEPATLLQELEDLRKRGHHPENLRISDRAHVVMPYHKVQDRAEEDLKGRMKAGTTGRGIGPAYEDKVGRFGIRMADLLDPTVLQDKLETLVPIKQRLLQSYVCLELLDPKAILREYVGYCDKIVTYATDQS